ncbi:putative translation initiation factor IF-2 [Streptomyces sp. 769]|nr:putative translation initiation factor IF-2 [Streptomyces sp. 769]
MELGHDDLALNTELLGEFVNPDLSHFAPSRSGCPPDRRYFMGVLIAYSSSAHRNLDLLPTREVPDRTVFRALCVSCCALSPCRLLNPRPLR